MMLTPLRAVVRRTAARCAAALVLLTAGPVWAAADSPPTPDVLAQPSAGLTEAPQLLSEDDVRRYRQIFALQEDGKWTEADKQIASLENDILLGHVLFQRYMHPTAYRSSFAELRDWMASYADHPGAARIYRLAKRRQPAGAADPRRPEKRRWRETDGKTDPFTLHNPPRSAAARRNFNRVKRQIADLISRERPTQALGLLEARRGPLTAAEVDYLRAEIAASYLAEFVDEKALPLAEAAAERSPQAVPYAHWVAGLAAWRLDRIDKAADHFGQLAKADHISPATRSAAAFWAARAHLIQRQPDQTLPFLKIAAEAPTTFYGVLALRQLGRTPDVFSPLPPVTEDQIDRLLTLLPVARAAGLAQIGWTGLAEEEIRRAHGRIPEALDPALLTLAAALDLPHAQLLVGLFSDDRTLGQGLYPVPSFAPADGFRIDRALLYAFMRQESKFRPLSESYAGAKGLMQITPITLREVAKHGPLPTNAGKTADLFDPATNLQVGQAYLERLMSYDSLGTNLFTLAVAYNSGPGNFIRWWDRMSFCRDDPLLFIESIPSGETRAFVEHILTNVWLYRLRLGQPAPSLDSAASGAWPLYRPIDGTAAPHQATAQEVTAQEATAQEAAPRLR